MPQTQARPHARALTYAGVFLVAEATLMLEVLLTRITSVSAWYHLAFFVISLAMLGMTAGAVLVFVWPAAFTADRIAERLAQSALGFALATPVCVAFALAIPLTPVNDLMSFFGLLVVASVLSLPFIVCGIALTLVLTRAGLPPSIAYGVDLVGAASGCALVIPVLAKVDAPSAAVLAGAIAALGAWAFRLATRRKARLEPLTAALLIALGFANAHSALPPLRPAFVKGIREDLASYLYTKWNTYSRVTVDRDVHAAPGFWAKGRNTPPEIFAPIDQRFIRIDGAAGTVMAKMGASPDAHAYLDWDITAAAHYLRPHGAAAVIGVGGGRDVLEAARVGHRPVVGIELNDLIVDLHKRVMADFSGIAKLDYVELVSDEARSFLARDRRHYDVITMSLIDTWASTGTGAYSLSENGLYTVEAWRTFLDRLTPTGVLSVSRWYFVDSPGETARMLALGMQTLWSGGARDPHLYMLALQNEFVATLLISRTPFSTTDIDRIQQLSIDKGFNLLTTPRMFPFHPMLKALLEKPTSEAMQAWSAGQKLDLSPPTDARPFFFNMLKPSTWMQSRAKVDQLDMSFLGNLQATQTLLYATLVSLLLSFALLGVPMVSHVHELRAYRRGDVLAALCYFALIGLGFMFVEMGLLSRLSVFLGHPTLALAVLLGGIIFFAGLGSILSDRIDLENARWAIRYPLIPAALVTLIALVQLPVMSAFEAKSNPVRVVISLLLLLPPALGLGLCFPLGLRLVERMERARAHHASEIPRLGPWLWGINGAFGVCASGLALCTSMVWGIPITLMLGAACYLTLPLLTRRLWRAAEQDVEKRPLSL